jgi:hypothetical protein
MVSKKELDLLAGKFEECISYDEALEISKKVYDAIYSDKALRKFFRYRYLANLYLYYKSWGIPIEVLCSNFDFVEFSTKCNLWEKLQDPYFAQRLRVEFNTSEIYIRQAGKKIRWTDIKLSPLGSMLNYSFTENGLESKSMSTQFSLYPFKSREVRPEDKNGVELVFGHKNSVKGYYHVWLRFYIIEDNKFKTYSVGLMSPLFFQLKKGKIFSPDPYENTWVETYSVCKEITYDQWLYCKKLLECIIIVQNELPFPVREEVRYELLLWLSAHSFTCNEFAVEIFEMLTGETIQGSRLFLQYGLELVKNYRKNDEKNVLKGEQDQMKRQKMKIITRGRIPWILFKCLEKQYGDDFKRTSYKDRLFNIVTSL